MKRIIKILFLMGLIILSFGGCYFAFNYSNSVNIVFNDKEFTESNKNDFIINHVYQFESKNLEINKVDIIITPFNSYSYYDSNLKKDWSGIYDIASFDSTGVKSINSSFIINRDTKSNIVSITKTRTMFEIIKFYNESKNLDFTKINLDPLYDYYQIEFKYNNSSVYFRFKENCKAFNLSETEVIF